MAIHLNGTTMDSVTATGSTSGTALQLSRLNGWSVYVAAVSVGNTGVVLPGNAEVGDIIEIYGDASPGVDVYPGSAVISDGSAVLHGSRFLFRMISAGTWAYLVLG